MSKLKLQRIEDDKPVRLTVELPAALHRDLVSYGEILGRDSGGPPVDPVKLIVPMVQRFIATDRGFAAGRRSG